ncbi:hypothetical protein CBS101457_006515 [Exobasidium rhododendri]|nr:hypothetical protein CBS101457_006515 [Exobasidium rhododendri]
MFKRLLFGNEESKLNFKTSTTTGIARLYSDPSIPASDTRYWRSYLQLFDSPTDVYSLVSVSDIRRALTTYPENVATLVQVLVKHLEGLQHDADFSPVPRESPVSPSVGDVLSAGLSKNMAGWMPAIPTIGSSNATKAGSSLITRDRTREALNCCRILTRVLPVVMEGDHDGTSDAQVGEDDIHDTEKFEKKLFWSSVEESSEALYSLFNIDEGEMMPGNDAAETSLQEDQFVIAESDEEDEAKTAIDPLGATDDPAEAQSKSPEEGPSGRKLGERLASTIINLLFYSGFTIPWTEEQFSLSSGVSVIDSRVHFTIWEKGIGSSLDLIGTSKLHETNRLELLRLLLVTFSKTIYIPAHLQTSTDNLSLRYVTTSLERSKILPLLCSLFNVSLVRFKAEGWLGGLTSLPAGFVKDRIANGTEDVRQTTTMLSLQLLNVLLGYETPIARTEQEQNTSTTLDTPRPSLGTSASSQSIQSLRKVETSKHNNLFRYYLSKLHRQSDFHLLSEGMFTLISQRLNPASLLNPATVATDTSSAGPHIPEAILLLWQLLSHNGKFRTFLLDDSNRSPQLLSHLLYHALNNKDSAARQGLVRLCIFVLQDISCDQAFAVNVCKTGSGAKAKITGSQRWGIAVGGGGGGGGGGGVSSIPSVIGGTPSNPSQALTGADILIQATYSLIASTKSTLSSLYAPLIITMTNLSPFFKSLSILTSNRLLALFTSFSNPSFLLADEGNPRLIYYLLEAINLTIQHGFNRNPNLIYALVRSQRAVEKLANFTLRRGIAEMSRMRKRAGVVESSFTSTQTASQPSEKREAEVLLGDSMLTTAVAGNGISQGQTTTKTTVVGTPGTPSDLATTSEKVRGKMRRTSNSSEHTIRQSIVEEQEDEEDRLVAGFNEEELWYAASTIGRNGFVPTQTWVTSWQKGLPLDILQLTLLELVPKVHDLCSTISSKSDADDRIVAFLREQTLDQILPPISSVQPRQFRWNPQVSIWLLSYLWGLIYLSSSLPFGIFVGSNARLFQLRVQETNNNARRGAGGGGRNEQLALLNVGNMVFGGLSQVMGFGQQPQPPSMQSGQQQAM